MNNCNKCLYQPVCNTYAALGVTDAVMEKGGLQTNLTEFAKEVHQNAVRHGWWDEERSFGEVIALCHCELSEAVEEYRNGNPHFYYDGDKPEGIAVELADCIIRILDFCGKEGIDIDSIIRKKHEFNKTRPYKHGGKVI